MSESPQQLQIATLRWLTGLTGLVWLSMIAVDFFLHAGLLAPLYAEPSPFLLPPESAFAFIPLGYASFALVAILLVWLTRSLHVLGAKPGFLLGLKIGGLVWGAFVLGLASISTASPILLAGWFVGQTLETSLGGAAAAYGLHQGRLKPLALRVALLLVASIILTILLQSFGIATPGRVL